MLIESFKCTGHQVGVKYWFS